MKRRKRGLISFFAVSLLLGCSDSHVLSHGDYTYDAVVTFQEDFVGADVYLYGYLSVEQGLDLASLYPTRDMYLVKNPAVRFLVDAASEDLRRCEGSYVLVTGRLDTHETGFKILTKPLVKYFPYIPKIGQEREPQPTIPSDEAVDVPQVCYENFPDPLEEYP